MTFLNALKPLLRGQSAVTFRLSASGESGYRLLVTPTLQGIDADTDNVELAHLQALLAAPFALNLPADCDLDQTLADAVQQYQALREPKLNELDAMRERMAAAEADAKRRAEEAKEAAKAKAAKGKPTPAKAPAKPIKPAPPPTGDMFGAAEAPPLADAATDPHAAAEPPAEEGEEGEEGEDTEGAEAGADDEAAEEGVA